VPQRAFDDPPCAARIAGVTQALPEIESEIGETDVPAQRMAILANRGEADGVTVRAAQSARALLIAGKPIGEPIAQYGPFVMNTNDEIVQAVKDFQSGRFGTTA